MLIITTVLTFVLIMNSRGEPYFPFLCDDFRNKRVGFMRNAVTSFCVSVASVRFLVIRYGVLGTNNCSILLCPFSVQRCRFKNRVEIFSRMFRVSSIRQYAMCIGAQARRCVFLSRANFFTCKLTVRNKRFEVPNDNGANRYEGDGAKIATPNYAFPFIPRCFFPSAI